MFLKRRCWVSLCEFCFDRELEAVRGRGRRCVHPQPHACTSVPTFACTLRCHRSDVCKRASLSALLVLPTGCAGGFSGTRCLVSGTTTVFSLPVLRAAVLKTSAFLLVSPCPLPAGTPGWLVPPQVSVSPSVCRAPSPSQVCLFGLEWLFLLSISNLDPRPTVRV